MENNVPQPKPLSKRETLEREYKTVWRNLRISKTRASVLRKQITESYLILENIRFDFLGDTTFRDYFTRAKKELEGAMSDFLLSDSYWEKRIREHNKMTIEDYEKKLKKQNAQPTESK